MSPVLDGGNGGVMLLKRSAKPPVIVISHVPWIELICSSQTAPPQGLAACAMPNDPCHITPHDALLPRERDKIHSTKQMVHPYSDLCQM